MIIKDVVDATRIRLRSPYFGYAALAFIGFNWKAIFLICLTEGTPTQRLDAFDAATSFTRLVIYPLLVGAAVAATSEWMRLAFNWISSYPGQQITSLQLTAEHRRLLRIAELEKARSLLTDAREMELLRRAKQDEAAAEISDDETKEKLLSEISRIRREADAKSHAPAPPSEAATEVLRSVASTRSGEARIVSYLEGDIISAGKLEVSNGDNARRYAFVLDGINELVDRGHLVKRHSSDSMVTYTLSSSGWNEADKLTNSESPSSSTS
ncbi:hypothetical protein [Stenotrophomonas sp. B1-1]|uniref:hypothetical protein n=1 Tax=Stenotrophomonas sp. B1-1 TaxID=2710648 RepID=UPI0013DB3414|nr:hypothetical protein [Stenotrophomonas sp. B1-1]